MSSAKLALTAAGTVAAAAIGLVGVGPCRHAAGLHSPSLLRDMGRPSLLRRQAWE
jgi:hypothetical protein